MTQEILLYIGTYTRKMAFVEGKSKGIYIYRLDPNSGALTYVSEAPDVDNPSFLAIDPEQRCLYAVNEVGDFGGQSSGAVSAFAIDPKTGRLTFLNQQPTHGAAPCHLSVEQTGRYVLAANYMGGNVCMLPIQDEGRLAPATDIVQHEGASVNPQRQMEPHAHSINLDPTNRYAIAADLGIDKLMIYQLDLAGGKLKPHHPPWTQIEAGSGPRHLDFHPSGAYAYLINELGSTITALAYNEAQGTLETLQTISTLPEDFKGNNSTADVHVSPDGKFLYGSNRGHNSIAIFAIDQASGKLTVVGHESTQGKTPRNFAIDPTGAFLLAANQDTDNVVIFRIDPQAGALAPTDHTIKVPTPVCLKLMVL